MSDVSPIIAGKGLIKTYESGFFFRNKTYALRDVDIGILPGETFVLVGESGSGKSTLGRLLLRLIRPSSGRILYRGDDITDKPDHQLASLRQKIQLIPQHPEDALNPRWKVKHSILEPYSVHPDLLPVNTNEDLITLLLHHTGLKPEYAERYPHQLSGGELQRAVIARALALQPDFIVCDEPTSMLDVSVQASIIHLLMGIQKKTRISLLFITHDIRLAGLIGDRIGVMFGGQIVEEGPDIFDHPFHPYSRLLKRKMLSKEKGRKCTADTIGCPWFSECEYKDDDCLINPPIIAYGNRQIRCHHPDRISVKE